MGSVIFSLFIVFCVGWVILRTGKRRAQQAMRHLAQRAGGVYMHGGFLSRSYVTITRGTSRLQIEVQSLSPLGGSINGCLFASWTNRTDIQASDPQSYVKSLNQTQNSSMPGDLISTASRFDTLPIDHCSVVATRGVFELSSQLKTDSPHAVLLWYEIATKYYELLLTETEPGVRFEVNATAPKFTSATCQVCGTPPDPKETVICDRCGAPHHAECWEYNGGCAIFGCKQLVRN